MEYQVGDNLTSYQCLDWIEGNDPSEIKFQLEQIRMPYKIIAIYGKGNRHYAWLSLSKALKKNKPKKREITDVSTE